MALKICCWSAIKKIVVDDLLAEPSCEHALLSAAVVLGLTCLTYMGLGLLKSTIKLFWPAKNLRKYGEWAIVTGATDGIGFGT